MASSMLDRTSSSIPGLLLGIGRWRERENTEALGEYGRRDELMPNLELFIGAESARTGDV